MEPWWPLRLPQRLFLILNLALGPIRLAAMLSEILLAGLIFAAILVGWAIYTKAIPESQVERVIATLGTHILSILRQQGVF